MQMMNWYIISKVISTVISYSPSSSKLTFENIYLAACRFRVVKPAHLQKGVCVWERERERQRERIIKKARVHVYDVFMLHGETIWFVQHSNHNCVLHCAVCCSVQRVAVCCSLLQGEMHVWIQRVVVCCSVLQCAAGWDAFMSARCI